MAGQVNHGAFDPSGKFLLLTGNNVFGTAGGLSVFSLDASTGSLTLATGSPFQVRDDPAGVAVDASGKFVYVAHTADATISSFSLDSSTGTLTPVPGSPFPSGGNGTINGPLGIAADIADKFIYVCNASNDVSAFSVRSDVPTSVNTEGEYGNQILSLAVHAPIQQPIRVELQFDVLRRERRNAAFPASAS